MKLTREEYIAHMNFQDIGKPVLIETMGPLVGLEDEWRSQGASEKEIALTAFDFDYVDTCGLGSNCDFFGEPKSIVVRDTPDEQITIDELGRHMKLKKRSASIPLPMDYPVETMEDWLKLKPRYVYYPERVCREKLEEVKKERDRGKLIVASIPGGFDLPRQLMGEENLCYAYYEQPELVMDIMNTIRETALRVMEESTRIVTVDCLAIHEDMAGKSGPLIGPATFREFVDPYYRSVIDLLKSRGCTLFSQDSDGNINSVLDAFMDAGLNCTVPCEPAAGMDIVRLREKYGKRLAIKGGIDKHVLRGTKEEIRKELEYKLDRKMWIGTIFGLDHRIPNGTPIENYRYYVNTAREILGKEPLDPEKEYVWKRISF